MTNSESVSAETNSSDEISFKDLIVKSREWYNYLLSRIFIIIAFGTLGAILGLTYAFLKKPVYTAVTTFVLEDSGGSGVGLGNLTGLVSMIGIDVNSQGGGIFSGDNIIELYKSRVMIEKTLLTKVEYKGESRLLINHYIEFNNLKKKWSKKAHLNHLKFSLDSTGVLLAESQSISRMQDSILGTVVNDIKGNYLSVNKPDKKLSIIKSTVQSQDEFFAKSFNDEIVKNVNDFYIQTKTKKSLENIEILQHKTDSVRAVMNGAIFSGAAASDATPNLNPTRQVQRIAPMQRSQFSIETNKAILGELIKNLEMSKMSLLKETPLIQKIDSPVYPLERERFSKLKGILFGGLLFAFLTVTYLVFKRLINRYVLY